jgi:hypothetical protein
MPSFFRRWLHRFIPSHFHDPVGLTRRLLRTGDPAAVFAMQEALLGLVAAPLDMLLQIAEQRRYRNAPEPRLPLLIICGAPRTGTTLVEQVLINHLPFAFINNLTAVFPRAPLTANRMFRPTVTGRGAAFHSYYGKTVGFSGPNDGLHLWDRWVGKDRSKIRAVLTPVEQSNMRRFFGAMEQMYAQPIVVKNNSLNTCAALVAEVLDQAVFICMTREPLFLAQAQFRARLDIHGVDDVPYGIDGVRDARSTDVVEDICRQVLFHHQVAQEQQNRLGPERFWIVRYEEFCRNPSALVDAVAIKVLGQPRPLDAAPIPPFTVSNSVRIDPERLRHIEATLARLGHPAALT